MAGRGAAATTTQAGAGQAGGEEVRNVRSWVGFEGGADRVCPGTGCGMRRGVEGGVRPQRFRLGDWAGLGAVRAGMPAGGCPPAGWAPGEDQAEGTPRGKAFWKPSELSDWRRELIGGVMPQSC